MQSGPIDLAWTYETLYEGPPNIYTASGRGCSHALDSARVFSCVQTIAFLGSSKYHVLGRISREGKHFSCFFCMATREHEKNTKDGDVIINLGFGIPRHHPYHTARWGDFCVGGAQLV